MRKSHSDIFDEYIQKRINAVVRTTKYKMTKIIEHLKSEIEENHRLINDLKNQLEVKLISEVKDVVASSEIVLNEYSEDDTEYNEFNEYDELVTETDETEHIIETVPLTNSHEETDESDGSSEPHENNEDINETEKVSVETKKSEESIFKETTSDNEETYKENIYNEEPDELKIEDENEHIKDRTLTLNKSNPDINNLNKSKTRTPFKDTTNRNQFSNENFYKNVGATTYQLSKIFDPNRYALQVMGKMLPLCSIQGILMSIKNQLESTRKVIPETWIKEKIKKKLPKVNSDLAKCFCYFNYYAHIYYCHIITNSKKFVPEQVSTDYLNLKS